MTIDPDAVRDMIAWARSRIGHCRREESKFMQARPRGRKPKGAAVVAGPDDMPQALIEAWTERRSLTAVLEQLGVAVEVRGAK